MSSQSWVTVESSMDGSRFSDVMSDEVTIEQQRKEELAAMIPPSEGSIVSGNSRRIEQWVDETCRERTNEMEEGWPNSNVTNELAAEEGCSRATLDAEANPGLQATMGQDLTYVGGMGYARSRGCGIARGRSCMCLWETQEGSTAHGECRRAPPRGASCAEHDQFRGLVTTVFGVQDGTAWRSKPRRTRRSKPRPNAL